MSNFLQKQWRQFKASAPGHRFQDVHKRHVQERKQAGGAWRWLFIGAGLLLIIAGVVLLAVPGPGSLVMLLGAVLIVRESVIMARFLDRVELLVRPTFLRLRRWWKRCSPAKRRWIIGVAGGLALTVAVVVGFLFFR